MNNYIEVFRFQLELAWIKEEVFKTGDSFVLMCSMSIWIRKQLLQMQKMANFRKLCLICAYIMLIQIQGKLETTDITYWRIKPPITSIPEDNVD